MQANNINIRYAPGLCYGTKFDYQYSWSFIPSLSGWYSFRGYYDTVLAFDDKLQQWKLQLDTNSSIFAVNNVTDYPIGTQMWEVHGDPCYDTPVAKVELSFNACNETEFNCHDGSCTEMDRRCDRKIDCPDKTGVYRYYYIYDKFMLRNTSKHFFPDEINCQILITDSSYLKAVPPSSVEGKPKNDVDINVDILSILDIVEVDFLISLQLSIELKWFDKRLSMMDLHGDTSLNTLTEEFKDKIWLPQVSPVAIAR